MKKHNAIFTEKRDTYNAKKFPDSLLTTASKDKDLAPSKDREKVRRKPRPAVAPTSAKE